jgi:hypothetical protein
MTPFEPPFQNGEINRSILVLPVARFTRTMTYHIRVHRVRERRLQPRFSRRFKPALLRMVSSSQIKKQHDLSALSISMFTKCSHSKGLRRIEMYRNELTGLEITGLFDQGIDMFRVSTAFGMQGSLVQIQSSRPLVFQENQGVMLGRRCPDFLVLGENGHKMVTLFRDHDHTPLLPHRTSDQGHGSRRCRKSLSRLLHETPHH